jgi:hypothetical protein
MSESFKTSTPTIWNKLKVRYYFHSLKKDWVHSDTYGSWHRPIKYVRQVGTGTLF